MLQKILLLAVAIAIVWYGFKIVGRLNQKRQRRVDIKEGTARVGAYDTVQCPVCNAFVATDSKSHCGNADCPY